MSENKNILIGRKKIQSFFNIYLLIAFLVHILKAISLRQEISKNLGSFWLNSKVQILNSSAKVKVFK